MVKIHSDNPTTDDCLGYQKAAIELTDIIKVVQPPFTIGIFSKWGFGKTTFMSMIESNLKNNELVKTLWFNPWKYDDKEIIWKSLITELYSNIVKDDKITIEFLKKTFERIGNFAGKISKRDNIGTEFFKIFNLEPQFLNKTEDITLKLINEYVGKDGKLVLFIDDMDRCLPESAIKVLEAIKLFFDNTKCIFVIGLDKSIIENGIHVIYDKKIGLSGVDYLEKIIQLPFFIPPVDNLQFKKYIRSLCDDSTLDSCFDIIDKGSDKNPRRVKRFLNIFNIQKQLSSIADLDEKMLAKTIMLQLRFPIFYDLLLKNPEYLNLLNSVIRMPEEKREKYLKKDSNLSVLFNDYKLRYFLENTITIKCSETQIIEYLQLAQN